VPLPEVLPKKITAVKSFCSDSLFDLSVNWFYTSEAPALGDTLPRVPASSYLNYLVTNGLVVVSSYVGEGSSKEKEHRAGFLRPNFPEERLCL